MCAGLPLIKYQELRTTFILPQVFFQTHRYLIKVKMAQTVNFFLVALSLSVLQVNAGLIGSCDKSIISTIMNKNTDNCPANLLQTVNYNSLQQVVYSCYTSLVSIGITSFDCCLFANCNKLAQNVNRYNRSLRRRLYLRLHQKYNTDVLYVI